MIVIIPHTETELALLKLQNELVQKFYKNNIICAVSPLWIQLPPEIEQDFSELFTDLKEAAKKINRVTIEEPALCNEGDFTSENSSLETKKDTNFTRREGIFCQVKLDFYGKEFNAKIELCRIIKKKETSTDKAEISSINSITSTKFPMQLKIFRLGRQENPAPYTKAISESVWRKIPKVTL